MSRDLKNYHNHPKCFGSTFLRIQICSKLLFIGSNYLLEILFFSSDTPLHLLGVVLSGKEPAKTLATIYKE